MAELHLLGLSLVTTGSIRFTCYNRLDLPRYANYKTLRQKVLLAVKEGSGSFLIGWNKYRIEEISNNYINKRLEAFISPNVLLFCSIRVITWVLIVILSRKYVPDESSRIPANIKDGSTASYGHLDVVQHPIYYHKLRLF